MQLQLDFHSALWKKFLSLGLKFSLINISSLFAVASGVIGNIAKSRIWFVTFTAAFQQICGMTRCIAVPVLIHDKAEEPPDRIASDF